MTDKKLRFLRIVVGLEQIHASRKAGWARNVLDECLGCPSGYGDIRDENPNGFWGEALQLFKQNGLDVEAFLVEFRKRLEEDKCHDACVVLKSKEVLDWIEEHI
ncbi:MAG: hypothetical protein HYT65_03100 [Candidatus Yanofskybacteria bacterium]|nr:hypothetical protein [Candidatus Yanofskybacteria bacterium]